MDENLKIIYHSVCREIGYTSDEVVDSGTLALYDMLISMNSEYKRLTFDRILLRETELKKLFLFAFKHQQFEVCRLLRGKYGEQFFS
jgi:hypothetical protein